MPTYRYVEPDTGLAHAITVSDRDTEAIANLGLGDLVILESGHEMKVDQNGWVHIADERGKKHSVNLAQLKNSEIE